ALGFLGGAEALRRCGASDAILARRAAGQWTLSTVAADSAAPPAFMEDATQCAAGQNQCNVGDVVGEWPALGFFGAEPALAYRDIHFGFTQDDELRSDLDIAYGGLHSLDAGW